MEIKTKKKRVCFLYALSFLFLVVFVIETVLVIQDAQWLVLFDNFFTHYIQSGRTATLSNFMSFTTYFGSKEFVFAVALVMVIGLFCKRKFALGVWLGGTVGLSAIFLKCLKVFIARSRPESSEWIINATSFSYPSGHLLLASIFYGLISLFFMGFFSKTRVKILIGIFTFLIIVFLAYTRVYLGVHYPSDTLGGFLFGMVWVFFAGGLYLNFVQKNNE